MEGEFPDLLSLSRVSQVQTDALQTAGVLLMLFSEDSVLYHQITTSSDSVCLHVKNLSGLCSVNSFHCVVSPSADVGSNLQKDVCVYLTEIIR